MLTLPAGPRFENLGGQLQQKTTGWRDLGKPSVHYPDDGIGGEVVRDGATRQSKPRMKKIGAIKAVGNEQAWTKVKWDTSAKGLVFDQEATPMTHRKVVESFPRAEESHGGEFGRLSPITSMGENNEQQDTYDGPADRGWRAWLP